MVDFGKSFDEFNLKARVYPVLLTCSPAIANILLMWPASPLVRLAPAALALGVVFFLADFVRGAGQKLEKRLALDWDGLPAQAALRLTDSENSVLTTRRRELVERLTGRLLPTKIQEKRNKSKADTEYNNAIRDLIPRVRGADNATLLHAENIRYNFRRNALACKRAALLIAGASTAADVVACLLDYNRGSSVLTLGVSLLVLLGWAVGVRSSWVKQAADTYRDRLYEALAGL